MEPLRNVLHTFLKRTPTIGYCQGMNFYAGTFLRYMSEEEAFWLFVCINENILPLDYYSDMLGILVDQRVFELLMVEKFPKLVEHMKQHAYQLDLISFQWLVTLFCSSLQHDSELFVLTAFVLKGCKIIIKIALLIIEHLQARVLAADQFDQIYSIISKDPINEITPKVLSKLLKDNKKIKLTNSTLRQLRGKVRPEIIATLQANLKAHQELKLKFHESKKLKFLNQFYVYSGLGKYYEHLLSMEKLGVHLDPAVKKEIKENLAIYQFASEAPQADIMKIFNCNPAWPICLYDYMFKNKSVEFLAMKK